MPQQTRQQYLHRAVASSLVAILLAPASAFAQAPQTGALPITQSLKILPLVGNNGVNDLERRVMTPLAVQILDQNDAPVDGATVVFRFPISGPSAAFTDQQSAQTVRTGANGQARATGWTANAQVGTFAVQVTATRGNEQGTGTITMTNITRVLPANEVPKKRWWTSRWAKIAYVAAAAGITTAVVLSTRSSSTTIQGTIGAPTIGGPQ
jgi:hypothetical protein